MKPSDPHAPRQLMDPSVRGAAPALTPSGLQAGPNEAAPPGLPPGLAAPPGVESLWFAVQQRWLIISVLGLAAAGAAFAGIWFFLPGKYSSAVLIHLNANPPLHHEGEIDFAKYQKTQAALVKSYAVLQETLQKPDVAELAEVQLHSDHERWLQKELVVDNELGPEIMRITLQGEDPEEVAVFLNELAETYMETYARREEAKLKLRLKQLKDAYHRTSDTLRERRLELRKREKDAGLEDQRTIEQRQGTLLQHVNVYQSQLLQLQLQKTRTETELKDALEKIKDPDRIPVSQYAVEEELQKEFIIRRHLEELAKTDQDLARLAQVAAAGSPDVKRLGATREAIVQALRSDSLKLQAAIEARLRIKTREALQEKIGQLKTLLELTTKQEQELTDRSLLVEAELKKLRQAGSIKTSPEIDALRDEVAQTEQVQKRLGDDLGTVEASLSQAPRVGLLQAAQAPSSRKFDRTLKMASAAALGAFGLVFCGIALMEFRARRVYTPDDVARGLGMPLMGTLPVLTEKARRQGISMAPGGGPGGLPSATLPQHFALLESVDSIRTMLLHAERSSDLQVVMITSAVTGEGKTSLACHLAASLARASQRTLLIDGDLRHPAVHQQVGVPLTPGLCEVLRGELLIEDVIQKASLDNLWVVPAGQVTWEAIQALTQERIQGTFAYLRERFDQILIDTSPVLAVTDPLLIGQHADAVLFSVMRNLSRLPAVYAAQQKLASLNIRMLGAVVIGDQPNAYGVTPYPTK